MPIELCQAINTISNAQALVAAREGETAAAEAVVAQREAELYAAQRRLARTEALSKDLVLPVQQLDDDQAQVRSAQAAVNAAK